VVMEPPRKHKFSGMQVKEEVKLEDGNVKVGKKTLAHIFLILLSNPLLHDHV
jgi:hypothetical protein